MQTRKPIKPRIINFLHPVMVANYAKSHYDPKFFEVTIVDPFNVIIEEKSTGRRGRTTMYNITYYQLEGDNDTREVRKEKEESSQEENLLKASDNQGQERGSDRPDPKPTVESGERSSIPGSTTATTTKKKAKSKAKKG